MPLIVPEIDPDAKQGELESDIVPVIAVPFWVRVAFAEPLIPKVDLQVPFHLPVRFAVGVKGNTVNDTGLEVPPPGRGFDTVTGKSPALISSEAPSKIDNPPLSIYVVV